MQSATLTTLPNLARRPRIEGTLILGNTAQLDFLRALSTKLCGQPTETTRIPHPYHGSDIFGRVPRLETLTDVRPDLPVTLVYGHPETFGARHIWDRHRDDVRAVGGNVQEDVAQLVARILQPGVKLFDVPRSSRPLAKLVAHRAGFGSVILSIRLHYQSEGWRVLTAYKNGNTHDKPIGQLSECLCLVPATRARSARTGSGA